MANKNDGKQTEPQNDGWEIDLRGWNRKQYRAWQEAAKTGDDDAVVPFYTLIVMAWPYAGDPANTAAYDDLNLVEWAEVNNRVGNALKSLGDNQ